VSSALVYTRSTVLAVLRAATTRRLTAKKIHASLRRQLGRDSWGLSTVQRRLAKMVEVGLQDNYPHIRPIGYELTAQGRRAAACLPAAPT